MGLLSLEEKEETPEASEKRPCEDTGRRWPPTSQSERPHQKQSVIRILRIPISAVEAMQTMPFCYGSPRRLNSCLKQINMGGSILLMKNISLIYIILISKSFATKDYFVIQNSYILFRKNQENVKSIKIHSLGLALWSSEEYALQYRVRGSNPWSGNRDPTCHGATKPMNHNYWVCVSQLESLCPTRKDPAWCHEDSMCCN